MKKIVHIVLFFAIMANAADMVAVLEITPSNEEINMSVSEYRHLTDELRTKARETLPSRYSVLTRDNIFQLLPTDEKEAECLAESCAVEIGRAIGAEYVTQGTIGKFEGMLTLTVELYESMSGNMLGSFVTESKTAFGLLGTIREKAPAMFAKIIENNKVPGNISTNIPVESKKGGNSFWVAVGLDVLGAAAIGIGIYNNAKASDYRKESERAIEDVSLAQYAEKQKEFEDNHKKMQDAGTVRNVFYSIGGVLLLGGIGVHIWF